MTDLPPYSIYDIDGTLASNDWRRGLVERSPKEWELYFLLAQFDSIVPNVLTMLNEDVSAGCEIVIVTGRPEKYRSLLIGWLDSSAVSCAECLMRGDDDRRPDAELKGSFVASLFERRGRPRRVVDDRRELDTVWQKHGFRVVRVTDPCLRPNRALAEDRLG